MEKRVMASVNQDNADAICAKIDQDASFEAQKMIERAKAQAKEIIAAAQKQAAEDSQAAHRRIDKEIEKDRDRLISTMNLEKKRLILEGKQAFVDRVLAEVRSLAGRWRQDRTYPQFLAAAVTEGMRVLDTDQAVIYYSSADEHIFDQEFVKKLTDLCSAAVRRKCELTFSKSDFQD
ncbi:MAG TPA: V-type ATP synthase subunit E family protein, partial [Candidatus Omnitrophota bacterium]|nr:V-type ATP synthase subunit E family protein [Candidatus Omnitrophota bacterium]